MKPRVFHYDRLVKSEDLNHHGTLFAGRSAEWFVEAGFIAAASVLPPKNIVCVKIHGLTFTKPIHAGEIVRFESKIVRTGTSSLTVYVQILVADLETPVLRGFITFVHVDDEGQAAPHGLTLTLETEEDRMLHREALELK
jgi:acyl-CoA hydrolase